MAVAALVAEPLARQVWPCPPAPMASAEVRPVAMSLCGTTRRLWQNLVTCGNARADRRGETLCHTRQLLALARQR